MVMVDVDGSCSYWQTRIPSGLAWSEGWGAQFAIHQMNYRNGYEP